MSQLNGGLIGGKTQNVSQVVIPHKEMQEVLPLKRTLLFTKNFVIQGLGDLKA